MSEMIKKQSMTGIVVSNKMANTIVVMIKNKHRAALYGKYVTRIQKIFAHDPTNQCKEGDWVVIEPCRPVSKKKSWVVVNVVNDE
jgi:small subunit ribosomal protein S17